MSETDPRDRPDTPDRVARLRALLDRFDGARGHFRESRRQALLGVREVMLVLEQLADEHADLAPLLRELGTGLMLARGVVDWFVTRVPGLDDEPRTAEIRLEAVGILRDLVAAELLRQAPDADPARREGLLTVLGVIDTELERLATELADLQTGPRADDTGSGVEWIEVEA